MTDDVAKLILDELRALRHGQEALRRGQEALRADIADVKISARQSEAMPGVGTSMIGFLQGQIASQGIRIDRFEDRLWRIQREIEKAEFPVS
jgi:hypothetical protein